MQKIYFNPKTNHTIIDVSGVKNPKKIEKEFGIKINDYQSEVVDEQTEKVSIENGKIVKSKIEKSF